ncbi:MAG: hypothetical protein ACHQ01_09875 [Candidatus Limnocylindrales bacterium]|jgi:hypothetical protein
MKPPTRIAARSDYRSGAATHDSPTAGPLADAADLLHQLALWLADVSAEAALREPDAQPEGQGEVVALERTAGRRQR